MKRTWNLISAGSMWLLLTGLLLSLLSGGGATSVNAAARICLAAAVALFIAATLLRPRALRAEAAGGIAGMDAATRAPQCDFRDVAANDEARASLLQLADYLREPQKYARYGARMPRGVLLYGPPGTGKTLLARALAGEAGVPFFALSGSDFVQMYVGVGASRVRELFKRARKAGRCVIFIDEIDAMAKKRDDMSSDERDQTLNALLSEMSGFRPTDGVIVLAATNRLEALDPALLRPGRFDRQIEVGLPGREERLSILRLHGRNKPLSSAVDLEALARDTSCFSGRVPGKPAQRSRHRRRGTRRGGDRTGGYSRRVLQNGGRCGSKKHRFARGKTRYRRTRGRPCAGFADSDAGEHP